LRELSDNVAPVNEGKDRREPIAGSSPAATAELGAAQAPTAAREAARGLRGAGAPATARTERASPAAVLALQRTVGNAAVTRMLQRQAARAPAPASTGSATPSSASGTDEEIQRAAYLDQAREIVISAFYGAPEYSSTPLLLDEAKHLAEDFARDDAPRTRIAAARALIAIAQVLHEREEAADVDERTWALLLPGEWGDPPKPWTPERPMSLDQIPPFGPTAELAWTATVLAESATTGPPQRGRRTPPTPPPPVRDDVPEVDDEELPAPGVASLGTSSKPSAAEKAAGAEVGGDVEISRGLEALRTVTDSQAAGAVQTMIGPKSAAEPAGPVTGSGRSLLELAGEMWFIERRLYVLDRTGHATASDWDDFAFDLARVSLGPGTYYFGPFAIGSGGFRINDLVKIDGGVTPGRGEIYPARVLTSLIPLLERGRGHLKAAHGVAIIVSSRFGQPTPDFDSDRLIQAVDRARHHAPWALRVKLAEMAEHPGEEVAKLAFGLALGSLTRAVPVVGQAVLAYQLLRLAAWMGEAADVAGRARSLDELDIAAQAVARKVVSWAVTEAVTRAAGAAGRAAVGAARGGSGGARGPGGPGGSGGGGPGGPGGPGGARPRRVYPDFAPTSPAESALVAAQAASLQRASGLRIRTDQILEAPWIGRTPRSTSQGWLRDSGRFWQAYSQQCPNESALLSGGRVVTPGYAQAMGWPASTVGQTLVHHHINNSRFVFPLPVSAHGPGVHAGVTVVATP